MKIISLVLAAVLLVTMTSATSLSSRVLPNTGLLTDLLNGLLKCLFDALKGIVGSDLTAILTEIKQALGKLGDCVNISSTNPDLAGILQCLLSKVGTISAEDLAEIVKRLQPILDKVNVSLTCIRALIKDICKIDICGIAAVLCDLNLPGIVGDLLATILKTLQDVITSLLTNGVCKGIVLPNTGLLTDLLKGLLKCLFDALNGIVGSDLKAILEEIKAALGQLGSCVDVNNLVLDVVGIVQCVLSKVGTISADNLADIVARLQPILLKLTGGLTCISALINENCKIDICGTLPFLCNLPSLGPLDPLRPLVELLKKIIVEVVPGLITALLMNGVCKVIALPNTGLVTNLLKGLLKCLFEALNGIVGSDLTAILTEIKQALGKLGDCVNISSTNPDLAGILQCLLSKVGTISAEDLAEIVKRLQPILGKVNLSLTCIRALIKEICKIDICPIPLLCTVPGVRDILNAVITALLTNGVCKLT